MSFASGQKLSIELTVFSTEVAAATFLVAGSGAALDGDCAGRQEVVPAGASETAVQQLGKARFCAESVLSGAGLGGGWAAGSAMLEGGFPAVFSQGLDKVWKAGDASFMLAFADEMKKVANIDPETLFMSGISHGGFLTLQTGCPNSDVSRGMAPAAGGSTCRSAERPIPVISFDAQPHFAYQGNLNALTAMARRNRFESAPKPCPDDHVETMDATTHDAVCRSAEQGTEATIVPSSKVTRAKVEPTPWKIGDPCDGGARGVLCDVVPPTEHGRAHAAVDTPVLYGNNTIFNPQSVAWRFFNGTC